MIPKLLLELYNYVFFNPEYYFLKQLAVIVYLFTLN